MSKYSSLTKNLCYSAEFSEHDLNVRGDNLQKLIDLVVDECIKVLDKQHVDIKSSNGDWSREVFNTTVNHCMNKVKAHFNAQQFTS